MSTNGLQPVPDDFELGATVRGLIEGQRLFNRFVLARVLGRGGMGVVWLARDEKLERDVALKFLPEMVKLDPGALDDLKRETRRSLDLTHPNIVRIYDFVEDKMMAGISMEYVNGPTLSGWRVQRENRIFEPAELGPWIEQACDALDYAHRRAKVVHRDLKPANLMVTLEGELKLADFGIARSVSDSVSRVTMRAGTSGTLVYMSPQQAQGRDAKPTDDIYSLGATIYELLTSKPPFYSGNIQHQVESIVPPTMAERREGLGITGGAIPTEWEETIAACLAKETSERPQSAAELAHRLGLRSSCVPAPKTVAPAPVPEPVVTPHEEPPAPDNAGTEPPLPGPKRKSGLSSVIAILLILAIGAGIGWYFWIEKPAEEDQIQQAQIAQQEAIEKEKQLEAEQAADAQQKAQLEAEAKAAADEAAKLKAQADQQAAEEAAAAKAKADADAAAAAAQKVKDDAAKAAAAAAALAVPVTEDTPLDQLQQLANAGSAAAESELGRRYRFGLGVDLDFKQALAWTQKAVDQGNADGENNLGEMYNSGQGVPLDYTQAASWFQKAADQGNAKGETNLGRMYQAGTTWQQGQGLGRDYQQALEWYQKAADQGYAPALSAIGSMYQCGLGVPVDNQKGLAWIQKAADLGDCWSAWTLGLDYSFDGIVKADPEQSRSWYQKALASFQKKADQGDASAMNMLGTFYAQGSGVTKDLAQADTWYRKAMASYQKAADQGDPTAAFSMASMYQVGNGTVADGQEALNWYKKSADGGYLFAAYSLASIYQNGLSGIPKDLDQARYWNAKLLAAYQKAADQGDVTAMTQIGFMYELGTGVDKDNDQALTWFKKAAEQGGANEQYQLGNTYDSIGTEYQSDDPARAAENYRQAMIWFKKAADNGNLTALSMIAMLYQFGEGVPTDKQEAISWYQKAVDRGDVNAQKSIDQLNASP